MEKRSWILHRGQRITVVLPLFVAMRHVMMSEKLLASSSG
jgi:hypothetical protein